MSLQTDEMNITVNDTESEVELSCEMTLFVREDEDLQWFRDGQMIENSGRRTVAYRNGTPNAAQRGGNTVIPGRVAVLTISNPVVEDSGTYTCGIAGTNESLDVQLSVLPAGGECHMCNYCCTSIRVVLAIFIAVDPTTTTTVLSSQDQPSPTPDSSPTPQPPSSHEASGPPTPDSSPTPQPPSSREASRSPPPDSSPTPQPPSSSEASRSPTPNIFFSPTPQPPSSSESEAGGDDTNLGLIIGVVAGALIAAIIVVAIVIVATHMYIRRKEPQPTSHIYDYVEPPDLPPRRSDTITMEDNSAYSRGGIRTHDNDAYASSI